MEINASLHRAHRPATWARWVEAVLEDFRFSAKFPKTVTHQAKLAVPAAALDDGVARVSPDLSADLQPADR